MDDLTHQDDH